MVSKAARDFKVLYRQIREDIFALCRALNFIPTRQQAEILDRINYARRQGILRNFMACKSGQGNGKSAIAFIIALFRVLQAQKSLAVLTAPTQRQCRDAFLTRGREIMAAANPVLQRIIEIRASKVEICGDKDWGIKTVTATDPKNAQGYHVPYAKYGSTLSIIMEEASGIDREIVTQFKGTISDPDVLMLMIGNPNLRDCSFFDCFNSLRDMWWTYTLNSEVTALENPEILHPSRNKEIEAEFGANSDVYRIRVLGDFPFQDPDCVISSEDLENCTRTDLLAISRIMRQTGKGMFRAHQFGIDFARFGGDESVIYQRLGNAIFDQWRGSHVDPNDLVDKAFAMQVGLGWSNEDTWWVPDAGGMGQGVMANFYRAGRNNVLEFHTGGTPADRQYANLMTEAWFNVGRMAKAKKLHIPKDQRLIQQLSSRRYTTNKDGRLIIWDKNQYMKEGHDSPDRADACVMAMYDQLMIGGQSVRQPAGKRGGARVMHGGRGRRVGADLR